jgi:hypothetical protein
MAKPRHRRAKHQIISPWPSDKPTPAEVADRSEYVGSAEHKTYPSTAGPPALRSDATPCDPRYQDFAPITAALREAIRRQCTSAVFIGDFPKYVWGWLDGELYEARHVQAGRYKGYAIGPIQRPQDNFDRLNWGAPNA